MLPLLSIRLTFLKFMHVIKFTIELYKYLNIHYIEKCFNNDAEQRSSERLIYYRNTTRCHNPENLGLEGR